MKHRYSKGLMHSSDENQLLTSYRLPDYNAIDTLKGRIRSSIDSNITKSYASLILTVSAVIGCAIVAIAVPLLALAAGVGICAALATNMAVNGKVITRVEELKVAYSKLADFSNAPASQINDTLTIVQKGIAGSIKDGALINSDKLAHLYSDTLGVVQRANEHKIPLTMEVKNALSNRIADQLNDNRKEKTFFQKVKAFFQRDGHIPMKESGYKVSGALGETLDTFKDTLFNDEEIPVFSRKGTFVDRLGNSELTRSY